MKVVQVVGCEALRFLDVQSAFGQSVHALSLRKLIDTFKIGDGPKSIADVDLGAGIVLQNGLFNGQAVIDQLKIQKAGLLVQCKETTALSDAIIDATIEMGSEIGLKFSQEVGRAYFSALIVELDLEFSARFSILEPIMKTLNSSLREQFHGLVDEYEGFGVHLWANKNTDRPQYFRLEKKVHGLADNHFFSTAPLSTEQHIEVLEQIESIP